MTTASGPTTASGLTTTSGPTPASEPTAILVLEPEHLIDVTEAASAVTASGTCVEIPFISRFGVHKSTVAMAAGTIINAAFDILLSHSGRSADGAQSAPLGDDDVLKLAEAGSRLSLATLVFRGLDLETFRTSIRPRIQLLRDMLESWSAREMEVESFFLSPVFGLQGRVDILLKSPPSSVQIADELVDKLEVVEMKSGRPHLSHQAQLAGYTLLLRKPAIARLWYVGQTENTHVSLADLKPLQNRLLEARNSIVQTEIDLAQRKFGVLKAIHPHIDGLATFQRAEAADFAAAYTSLDPVERTAFQAWVSFLARESAEQRVGTSSTRTGGSSGRALADLWRTNLEQKRQSSTAITDLTLDPEASDVALMHLVFRASSPNASHTTPNASHAAPNASHASFALRVGDPIFLYPQDASRQPYEGPLFKGSVISVSGNRIDVTLRNKHAHLPDLHAHLPDGAPGSPLWVVEQDASDSQTKHTYGCVSMWMRAPREKRQMLLGLQRPRFNHSGNHPLPKSIISDPHSGNHATLVASLAESAESEIFDDQRAIIDRALSARDFFLVQGPPGTGKTSTILRSIVTQLLQRPDERLLILAYTNRAADEICSVLQRYVGDGVLLRHGSRAGARGDDSVASLLAQHTPADAARLLADCKCIVSTVSSAINQPDIFSFGAFTTAIVDEASQVLEPMLTGLLAQTGRFILIGDVCQLPAVVSQPADGLAVTAPMLRDICMTSLGMSMFERLYRVCVKNGWHDAYAHLTRQGRMHNDVQAFPSKMFYGGRLEPLAHWQESSEPWITSSDKYLARVLETRATFIAIDDTDQQLREATLATRLAKQILVDAHALGIEASIGIITPFRAQNNLVLQMLHDQNNHDQNSNDALLHDALHHENIRRHISVDTVERFQGSERDVIIYAVSAASMADMTGIASEITLADGAVVDRKLNVALTRAKQHIIVIGNPRFLRASTSYANLIDHLTGVAP